MPLKVTSFMKFTERLLHFVDGCSLLNQIAHNSLSLVLNLRTVKSTY